MDTQKQLEWYMERDVGRVKQLQKSKSSMGRAFPKSLNLELKGLKEQIKTMKYYDKEIKIEKNFEAIKTNVLQGMRFDVNEGELSPNQAELLKRKIAKKFGKERYEL